MSKSKQGVFDGENNPMYGKTHTIDSRQSISSTRKSLGLAAGNNEREKTYTPNTPEGAPGAAPPGEHLFQQSLLMYV